MGSAVVIIVALAMLPASLAAPLAGRVWGSLEHTESSMAGRTVVEDGPIGAAFGREDALRPLVGSWSLAAPEIVVNWTRRDYTAIGSPTGGASIVTLAPAPEYYGEESYSNALATGRLEGALGGFLVLPLERGSLNARASVAGMMRVTSADEDRWELGFETGTIGTPNGTRVGPVGFELTPGQPVFEPEDPVEWTFRGDFVLWLWGLPATITLPNGSTESYRSGVWEDPGASPATSDGHVQMLGLRVRGATLSWEHEAGPTQWTAEGSTLTTQGRVRFQEAWGRLAADQARFEAEGEAVNFEGLVTQVITGGTGKDRVLRSDVTGQDASLDLVAVPVQGPTTNSGWGWLLGLVVVGIAASGATWLGRRRHDAAHPQALLEASRDALTRHRPRRARRLAARVLRHDAGDSEAWFLKGASLVVEGRFRELLDQMGRALDRVDNQAPLAFLAGLACQGLGREQDAEPWFAAALRDPEFAAYVRTLPFFDPPPVQGSAGSRAPGPEVARAYA